MRLSLMKLIYITSLLLFSSASFAATDRTWAFKVYLGEKDIGSHTFALSTIDKKTHVIIDADFNVYFLFINAYSYEHSNYEIWNGDCLHSITSSTNDNGDIQYVNGTKNDRHLNIETHSGPYKAEGCIRSFAYWDPSFLKSQALLNAQTGEILSIRVEHIKEEEIMVRNARTLANHYRLHTDKFTIDLWYSKNNEWLALNSTTAGGSVLRYIIQ